VDRPQSRRDSRFHEHEHEHEPQRGGLEHYPGEETDYSAINTSCAFSLSQASFVFPCLSAIRKFLILADPEMAFRRLSRIKTFAMGEISPYQRISSTSHANW
jgi:hypothetical protein